MKTKPKGPDGRHILILNCPDQKGVVAAPVTNPERPGETS